MTWITVLCCLLVTSYTPTFAMSDADKAVWGASEKVDTFFTVPSAQGSAVMGKAQGIVSQWNTLDRGMTAMKIQTVTDSLIETYNPTDIGDIGFNVTKTTLSGGDQISVSTMYYTGNIFSVGQDRKNANKRAHLLSYILQVYAKQLADAPAPAPTAIAANSSTGTSNPPALPDDLDSYLKIVRLQLSEGKYELALASLEGLKSVITDKEKAALSGKTPVAAPLVAPLPVTTPMAPATPVAPSGATIKPPPAP